MITSARLREELRQIQIEQLKQQQRQWRQAAESQRDAALRMAARPVQSLASVLASYAPGATPESEAQRRQAELDQSRRQFDQLRHQEAEAAIEAARRDPRPMPTLEELAAMTAHADRVCSFFIRPEHEWPTAKSEPMGEPVKARRRRITPLDCPVDETSET